MKPQTTPTDYGCLDFRRETLANPKQRSTLAAAHVAHCDLCQAFARRVHTMESAVAETLQVPIPEGLAERAILRAMTGEKQRNWRPWALAASLVLGSVLSLGVYLSTIRQQAPMTLAQAAAEHREGETLERLVHFSEKPERFGAILASFGGQIQAPVGEVDYIHLCPIQDHGMGWHIVYNTPYGRVTLLLVAAKSGEPEHQVLDLGDRKVLVHRAGKGYYALVADTQAALDSADQMLRTRVKWS